MASEASRQIFSNFFQDFVPTFFKGTYCQILAGTLLYFYLYSPTEGFCLIYPFSGKWDKTLYVAPCPLTSVQDWQLFH